MPRIERSTYQRLVNTSNTMPCTHFPLLSLPYEIRLIIYEFSLALQLHDHVPFWQEIKQEFIYFPIFLPFRQTQKPDLLIGPPDKGFCALRLTSKQLSHETARLIRVPGIVLNGVQDDLSKTLCNDPKLLEWLRQKWVRENLVSMNLHFEFIGNPFPYRGEQVVKRYPSNGIVILRKICWVLGLARGWWRYDWEFHFVPRYTLAALCKVLAQCPKLEKLELTTDHEAFFQIWKDPFGDVIALRPLVERGVEVKVWTQNCEQWTSFLEMKSRMMNGWGWMRRWLFGGGFGWRVGAEMEYSVLGSE